jgi:hypothetical protein
VTGRARENFSAGRKTPESRRCFLPALGATGNGSSFVEGTGKIKGRAPNAIVSAFS